MTDVFGPDDPNEPEATASQPPGPELGEGLSQQPPLEAEMAPAPAPRRRRRWLLPAVGVGALAVVAGGASWAAMQLMSSGDPVTSALPDSTLAFAGVDLDPSASQKIEAIQTMRKIPALAEHLHFNLDTTDDLRQWVTGEIAAGAGCDSFDYDTYVKPWLGSRAAVAGAENAGGDPVPFFVVQVSDEAKARAALKDNFGCPGDAYTDGLSFVGQYALFSEHQDDADYLAKEATKAPLEQDADYQKWMKRVGDPGIVTMYAAPEAMSVMLDQMTGQLGSSQDLSLVPGLSQIQDQADKFTGMAAVVRFNNGGIELETVADSTSGISPNAAQGVAPVADLPDTTAVAVGASLPEGWQTSFWDAMKQSDPTFKRDMRFLEQQTGLNLPQDLVTLFGDGFAFSVDSSFDPSALMAMTGAPDASALPIGLRISGDTGKITAVVDKLNGFLAFTGFPLQAVAGDGVVGVSPSRGYASRLSQVGTLGDTKAFQDAVADGANPGAVYFVDLSTVGTWVDGVAGGDPDAQEVSRNLDAFVAVGVSSWQSDGLAHGLVKVNLK